MTALSPALPDIVPPAERERWHEMLKISHLVIVLLYMRMRAPRCVTQMDLAEHFLIDRKTAAGYLRQLAARHFIAKVGYREGYALAEGGNSMLEKWGKTGHFSLKESFKLKLKDSKDLKKERKKEVGKNWTLPSVEMMLSQTGQLFEQEVVSFGVQDCDPLLTLALLAHAYNHRDRLRAPAVFVYQRLARSKQPGANPVQYLPDKKYRLDPMEFLPNPFLHALGLAELEILDEVAYDVVDDEESDDVPPEIVQAWLAAREKLDRTMPNNKDNCKADLLNLVRTQPARFVDNTLYLTAIHQWDNLNKRAARLVEALMPGIRVCFVPIARRVAAETEG